MAAQARRFSIISHGVSRSEREITQKSCASGAPKTAPPLSAAVSPDLDLDARIIGCKFQNRARHAVYAGISRADKCHGFAALRGLKRPAATVDLLCHARCVHLFFGIKRADKIDVDGVAA